MPILNIKKSIYCLLLISIFLVAGCGSAEDAQRSASTTVTAGPSTPNKYYLSLMVNPTTVFNDDDVAAVVFVFSDAAMTVPVSSVDIEVAGSSATTGTTGGVEVKVNILGSVGTIVNITASVDATGATLSIPVVVKQ